MKTPQDPRHQKRIVIVQDLFSWSFKKQNLNSPLSKKIIKNFPKIDPLIKKYAPSWPIEKIAKIDLAILRLAIFEMTIEKEEPPKVIIDEAIELAKTFGGERSAPFINGVLGSVFLTLSKNETKKN